MPDLFDENGFLDRMTGFTGGGLDKNYKITKF